MVSKLDDPCGRRAQQSILPGDYDGKQQSIAQHEQWEMHLQGSAQHIDSSEVELEHLGCEAQDT